MRWAAFLGLGVLISSCGGGAKSADPNGSQDASNEAGAETGITGRASSGVTATSAGSGGASAGSSTTASSTTSAATTGSESGGGSTTTTSQGSDASGTNTNGSGVGGSNTSSANTAGGMPAGSGSVFLSDTCDIGGSTNAWGPVEQNLSNGEDAERDGGPITIDDVVYDKGLGMHAPAEIGYRLGSACTSFRATVGLDDEIRDAGSVVFEVYGDDMLLYQSSTLTGADGGVPVEVDVSGINELRLVVSDDGGNGSDHADWAEARVDCTDPPLQLCQPGAAPIVPPDGYELAWSDEFDGQGAPDPDNWSYEQGFVRNEELQWYQPDNAWQQAGFLIIEGRREQVANPNYQSGSSDWKTNRQASEYTSTSMHSRGKREFQYGIFEMRGRLVASPGLWPAWWTLGVSGEWPSNGEIDMLEYYGDAIHANTAVGTGTRWEARWDSVSRSMSSFDDPDWDAKFHVWRMVWTDQRIDLMLDGETLNSTTLDDMLNPGGDSPFRQPHYMLLNLAIGGQAGGDPSGTHFPSRYEVDYVRVFQ